jgi:hypothetical protein
MRAIAWPGGYEKRYASGGEDPMPAIDFDGESYNDDRVFVMAVCRCTVSEVEGGVTETVIYHENAPADHIWAVVTYRNTCRYRCSRVDHFPSFSTASAYMRSVEPTVPRVSLGGASPGAPIPYEEFLAWKIAGGLQEYDYRKVFSAGGENAREVVLSQRRSHHL